MKKKPNLEIIIMISWQTILVWTYALKHNGKDERGVYNANGLRLWNPFSWATIIFIFTFGLIVEVSNYTIEFIKEFNKTF